MKFKGRIEPEHGIKLIHIIPLINLIFLLLIFILLAWSLNSMHGQRIDFPAVFTAKSLPYQNLEIAVAGSGQIYFGDKILSEDDLKKLFQQAALRRQAVIIKADSRLPLDKITRTWDLARKSGVDQLNIITDR